VIDLPSLLYRAASTPHGISVETNDVTRLRAQLYAEIRKSPAEFGNISLVPSPVNPLELWIINKEPPRE
jgi:hypothetical protein